jgi:AsmA protein
LQIDGQRFTIELNMLRYAGQEAKMSDDTTKKKSGIFKWIIIIVALLVLTILALPLIIDANQFRPQIQSRISSALGRDARVGNMKLSLLSGAVVVDDIAISDNPSFSSAPFITAKSLKIGIEVKPLIFSKAIHITSIVLDEPIINLIRSASGKWNFSDIGNTGASGVAPGAQASGGVSEADISIKALKVNNGRIIINQGETGKPSVYDQVNIAASDLSYSSVFPFTLSAVLPGGGSLQLAGKAGPLSKTDMITTPLSANISVKRFDLVASGAVAPDSGMAGLIDFGGVISSDGTVVQSKGEAKADKLQMVKGGLPAGQPVSLGYTVNYNLAQNNGRLNDTTLQYGKAVAQLNGTLDRQGDSLFLKMKLRGTDMPVRDIKALLPAFGILLPKGASLEGGSLAVDMASEGKLDRLVTAGTVELSKSRLTGFDLGGKLSSLATLAGIQSNSETEIEKLSSGVRLSNDGIQVSNMDLIVPALGKLTGNGRVASDQALDFKMLANLKPASGIGASLARLAKVSALNIPFFVRGTASDPKFVLDAQNAAGSLLGSTTSGQGLPGGNKEIGKALGNTLRNFLNRKK